jgi:PTH1 family peptidyl-tRNA hydrolase
MKIVVGLGNPGRRYEKSRHNIGFDVLRQLSRRWNAGSPRSKFEAELVEVLVGGQKVLLLCPMTYMNESGRAVGATLDYFDVAPQDVLVVCDDFNLPVGRLRFRPSGSAGGQKGLADILRRMGMQEIPRLRVGIGPLKPQWDVADFVLSRFDSDDREVVDEVVEVAADGVEDWVRKGVAFCMNRYNGYPNKPSHSGDSTNDNDE